MLSGLCNEEMLSETNRLCARRALISLPVASLLVVLSCARTETLSLDLLPAGSRGRIEAALRMPKASTLDLALSISLPSIDEAQAEGVPRLEIWAHYDDSLGELVWR